MKKLQTILALTLLGIHALQAQYANVNIQFVNGTQGEQDSSNIWVNFANGGGAVLDASTGTVTYNATVQIGTATINGTTTAIYTNSSYLLSTVANGTFSISSFGGGRGYVSYGAALSNYNPQIGPYAGWQPAPAVPDPNFTTRFQAFELTTVPNVVTTNGTSSWGNVNQTWADLSYIDQIGISTGIKVLNAPPGATNTTQWSANTHDLVNAVAVYQAGASASTTIPGTNVVTKATGGQTQYYSVAGSNPSISYNNYGDTSIANPAPNLTNLSNFVRIAGPGQMPALSEGGETALYHTWDNYITALSPGGSLYNAGFTTTTLDGSYGTTGVAAEAYSGNATFNTGTILLGGTSYTGYVLISGITYNGTAQDDIVIPFSSLTASTGLYGTNPGYATGSNGTYSGLIAVPGNTLQTRIAGDLVAGMNFGFLGSTTSVTYNGTTQELGLFSSEDWWAIGGSDASVLFGGAQSNPDFYNTYSAALASLTSAYTFGIQDRLGQNTAQFDVGLTDTNTVLQFIIQPDLATVPEPTAAALAGAGLLALALLGRKGKTKGTT